MEDKDISKNILPLNELVHITNDRIEGYETASQLTDDKELQDLFRSLILRSQTFKIALTSLLHSVGAKAAVRRRSRGKMHRFQSDLQRALKIKDRGEILRACEYGESSALEAFDNVLLHSGDLSENVVDVLSEQQRKIRDDHERIRSVRGGATKAG